MLGTLVVIALIVGGLVTYSHTTASTGTGTRDNGITVLNQEAGTPDDAAGNDGTGTYDGDSYFCTGVNDYPLQLLDEVATNADFIQVEYWWSHNGDEPEREVLLDADTVPGGRFLLNRELKGHVWELAGCTSDEAISDVNDHIDRRCDGDANNDGWGSEEQVADLFEPAKGDTDITDWMVDPGTDANEGCSTSGGSGTGDDESDEPKATVVDDEDKDVPADEKMQGCPASTPNNYKFDDGIVDFKAVGPAIVNPYWHGDSPLDPSFGDEQVAVFIPVGTTATFNDANGETYEYVDNEACLHNIPIEMEDSGRTVVELDDLVDEGLATIADTK